MIPLRMTRIPFNGTCWMTWDEIHLARTIATVFLVMKKGRPQRDPNGRYAVKTKGMPFEALPFRYLDWLVCQDWIYGEFRTRLISYLTHPRNAQYLDELFEPQLGNVKPATQRPGNSKNPIVTFGNQTAAEAEPTRPDYHSDKWHGQPMPKEQRDEPRKPWMNVKRAWSIAVDMLLLFEQAQDINDLLEISPEQIAELAEACTMLPDEVVSQLRVAWKNIRSKPAFADSTYFWAEYAQISPADLSFLRHPVGEETVMGTIDRILPERKAS
jgi:hypothetical protein